MTILLVGLGAALGAILRYQLTRVGRLIASEFPLVTFLINLLGSFCLGWLTAAQIGNWSFLLLGTGVLGGFTTFSTFNSELSQLWFRRRYKIFLGYLILTYTCGILVAMAGFLLGQH